MRRMRAIPGIRFAWGFLRAPHAFTIASVKDGPRGKYGHQRDPHTDKKKQRLIDRPDNNRFTDTCNPADRRTRVVPRSAC